MEGVNTGWADYGRMDKWGESHLRQGILEDT